MTTARSSYLPHVDALRAVAVLAVVIYHLDSRLLPGGFAGVDVFFVISGFVVSRSADAHDGASLRKFAIDFFARRVRRIVPALVVCLLVTALATMLWIPPSWLSDNIPRTGRYAFFGASNLVLSTQADSYFSPLAEFNPFTHTWSLGVEEQFYLLFPGLFYLWTRGGLWRHGCAAIFLVLGAASFVYAVYMHADGDAGAYYLLSTRYWELAVGVLLYMAQTSLASRRLAGALGSAMIRGGVALGGLSLLAYAFLFLKPETLPGYGAVLPVIAAMAFLVAMPRSGSITVGRRAPVYMTSFLQIGRLSYSLYLWHWPVIVLFKWTVGLSGPWFGGAALALTGVLAWASWRFVEQPFRSPLMPSVMKAKAIVAAVAAVCLGSFAARTMERHQPHFTFSSVAQSPEDWYPSRGQKLVDDRGCRVVPSQEALSSGRRITYRRSGCETPVSAPRLFAIGDSHALSYGPAFAAYALETGGEVTVYNNGGCPFLSLQPWREDNALCRENSSVAMNDLLPRLEPSDVVFLPSLRLPRFVDQWIVFPREEVESLNRGTEASLQAAVRSAAGIIGQLRGTGAKVVLQAPGPVLKAPAFRCVDWWSKSNEICAGGAEIDRAEFLSQRSPMLHALEELARGDDGVTVFDAGKILCPEGPVCSAFANGRPLFFDGDHISAYGNSVLLPSLMNAIRQAVVTD
ncbi:acyltransferase family protein [Luteibacter yeojuensis]|uniref:Acyltransferase n=1 Tax=Luteibacter yeojuensis TaxID=345309 RepID=A0A7X5QUT0_9GAMM|nr:acyltransferase family protein [Luteibacter yeojuensis]NID15788.1 acyltransferase [Luteibacter yeojuensis]